MVKRILFAGALWQGKSGKTQFKCVIRRKKRGLVYERGESEWQQTKWEKFFWSGIGSGQHCVLLLLLLVFALKLFAACLLAKVVEWGFCFIAHCFSIWSDVVYNELSKKFTFAGSFYVDVPMRSTHIVLNINVLTTFSRLGFFFWLIFDCHLSSGEGCEEIFMELIFNLLQSFPWNHPARTAGGNEYL